MAFKDDLAALRETLAEKGVSVGAVLRQAGVDRSTWTRWNNGTAKPRLESWAGVCAAADRLVADRREGRAA